MQVKYKNFCVLQITFFSLKFVGIVFVSSSSFRLSLVSKSITSSQIIAESSVILAKYFQFSQIHLLGLQR